jgi:hypothetical protein
MVQLTGSSDLWKRPRIGRVYQKPRFECVSPAGPGMLSTINLVDLLGSGVSHYIWDNMRNHAAMGSLLKSPVPQERTLVVNLVSRILEEARGVFIWVKLVLEKLLEARTQGAELEELYQVLISLPQELEDLYAVLLTRHKTPDYQREAYAMLEVLLRTPQRLSVHLFRCIVKCATLKNLDECA